MPPLLATYRLQVNPALRLRAARALVPYLRRLGITHLYSSPLLRARPGSTHGYDVVDPTRLNPELGDDVAFARLTDRLWESGMGLVLDIVPNHMAADTANPFWENVLEHGRSSAYARWFDIDWEAGEGPTRGRVLLPVLGDWFASVLAAGQLELTYEDGRFRVRYFDRTFPIDPRTAATALEAAPAPRGPVRSPSPAGAAAARAGARRGAGGPGGLGALAAELRALPPRTAADQEPDPEEGARRRAAARRALRRLRDLVERSPAARERLEGALAAFRGSAGAARLRRLLEAQAYALVHWRRARAEVNYRRFFDIDDLVGLRVEDPEVFAATHARILEWVGEGRLDGLRIDHVDGLLDPRGYLERLRASLEERKPGGPAGPPGAAGDPRRFPVFVEKILARGEQLRPGWPVEGTTGYDFLNELEAIFLDAGGVAALETGYRVMTGRAHGFAKAKREGKRRVLVELLATDVQRLALRLRRIVRREARRRALPSAPGAADLAAAIVETIVHLPVYRTYVDGRPGPPRPTDRELIERAVGGAREGGRAPAAALDLLERVLLLEGGPREDALERRDRLAFVQRFQQVSGPAAAKGVEDTALYVHVPLTSRNEVGGAPDAPLEDAAARLHTANLVRTRSWPRTLLCTTTHDTKRSADVRARLDVLSEVPRLWLQAVARWQRWNERHRRMGGVRRTPDRNTEYLLYQALVGVWPLPPIGAAPESLPPRHARAELRRRLAEYMRKAAREAKVHTSWTDPGPAFEEALEAFVRAILPERGSTPFLLDVARLTARVARPGLWNALARTLVHLTAPGVPDLYQGDELWNFALVDPDNRRPVDFGLRARLLEEVEAGFAADRRAFLRAIVEVPEDGRLKLHVIRRALAARGRDPELFLAGGYRPLRATGRRAGHVFTFARRREGRAALAVVPRLTVALVADSGRAPRGDEVWGDTTLRLSPGANRLRWENALTGATVTPERIEGRPAIRAARVLEDLPVALLLGS